MLIHADLCSLPPDPVREKESESGERGQVLAGESPVRDRKEDCLLDSRGIQAHNLHAIIASSRPAPRCFAGQMHANSAG